MREYIAVAAIAALVTYLTTPLARRVAVRLGAMATVRDRDVHSIPTPRWGGIAILAGLGAAIFAANHLQKMQEVFAQGYEMTAVVEAGALICLIGVIDDRWGVDALTKLAGQVLAAGVLVIQGVQLLYIPVPGVGPVSLGPEYGVPLTVLLVVVTINAVNFIDGLDGLAAGVVGIAAVAFFVYTYSLAVVHDLPHVAAPALICAALAGACAGFLPHNFNPARVFMGDSGSMLIGLFLGAATVTMTGSTDPDALTSSLSVPAFLPLMLPFATIAVPFVDLLLAVFRRARHGRSPFAPDKLHLHHRLLEIGHTQTRAVLIMYLWTALLGAAAVGSTISSHGLVWASSLAGTMAVLLFVAINLPRLRAAHRG
ncbi:MAG: glycosyl transferase, family 4 [Frankiales bacterium]|nr:glycosyl transferase, family 4 [Frankiales bacterium]